MPEVRSAEDFAAVLNYYEHLVQEWESWGEAVRAITEGNEILSK